MEEISEKVIEAAVASDPVVVISWMQKIFGLVQNMMMYAGAFVCFSVGMVYFRQESMLYHPAVPDERYKNPDNMPHPYANPK